MTVAERRVLEHPIAALHLCLPELLTRWNLDPVLLLALAALVLAWSALAGSAPERRKWSAAATALALLLFVSPFCALTSGALFRAGQLTMSC